MDEFIEVDLSCFGKKFLRTKRIDEISKQCLLNCNRQWVDAMDLLVLAESPDISVLRTVVPGGENVHNWQLVRWEETLLVRWMSGY